MQVVICGGTGFLGSELARQLLARGDAVSVLTRAGSAEGTPQRVHWDPERVGDWASVLQGADAVVNLAGAQAVGVRYTAARKRAIRESRLLATRSLVSAIEQVSERPRVLVSVSGIGYYGDHPAPERVDESVPAGSDFLARLCVEWEAESERARVFGVRVVNPRMGIVLGPGGGPLETMALPFKLFVGGKIGSGEQGVSWIHLDDAIKALLLCIDDERASGKLNVCSPAPVSNAELSAVIARALRRPAWLTAPAFGLKALFGAGAEPILTGQFALPRALERLGFRFGVTSVEQAVASSL